MAEGAVAPSSLTVALGRVTKFEDFFMQRVTVKSIDRLCPSAQSIAHNKRLLGLAQDQGGMLTGRPASEGPALPPPKRARRG